MVHMHYWRLAAVIAALLTITTASAAVMDGAARAKAKEELSKVAPEVMKVSRAFNLIHEIAGPSVVSIHTREQLHLVNRFDLREEVREVEVGEGSGFIFHSDDKFSYILTNSHVVLQTNRNQEFIRDGNRQPVGYDKIAIVMNDNRQVDATYVGYDMQTDLAVLKITLPHLPTIEWGDSDQAHVGDWVLALGYPFGVGYSATSGIISATDRSTGIYQGVGGFESFIQTDAAINPGNSGGPLVGIDGKVIGVNANIISKVGVNIGLGFAIPANLARRVAEDIRDNGKVSRPMVGIYLEELTPEQAKAIGLPEAQSVRLTSVVPGSPAETGGLVAGDVILTINQVRIQSLQQFRSRIASCRINEPLDVKVWRGAAEVNKKITPIAEEEMDAKLNDAAEKSNRGRPIELPAFGLRLGADDKPGALVMEVKPGSPADVAGLSPGDRILNERTIGPIRQLKDIARLAQSREMVLQVLKDGRSIWVRLRN